MHRKQITAARATVAALGPMPEEAALAQLVLGLAKAVDDEPSNAALWREYRLALATFRNPVNAPPDEEHLAFWESIRTPRVGTPRVATPRINSNGN